MFSVSGFFMLISVLVANHQRVVLWGCTVSEKTVQAELFYLGSHLPAILILSDKDKTQTYKIQIPQELRNLTFPKKGQNILLKIIPNGI